MVALPFREFVEAGHIIAGSPRVSPAESGWILHASHVAKPLTTAATT
jgi:hypothetical protein